MNATASPAVSPEEGIGARLRSFLIGSGFALVLLVPKFLRLRHNPQSWLAFRVLLGLAGASLVILPLSFATSWFAAILGLGMFLTAILLPPAKADNRAAERAQELGALVVVNGGEYKFMNGPTEPVQLFVCSDRILALDSALQIILQIPAAEISSVNSAETRSHWILCVRWQNQTADFEYHGVFAEHLARVAENTVRSVMHSPLPVLQQRQAAGG